MIRAARVDELGRLRAIERQAGAMFRSLGMDAVADDEPLSLEALRAFQSDGRAWVYVDGADVPLAYLLWRSSTLRRTSSRSPFTRRDNVKDRAAL